jgi:hypothetical protein
MVAPGKFAQQTPPGVRPPKDTPPFPAKPGERSEDIGVHTRPSASTRPS